MAAETAQKGHFYIVGVGPGASDLLTLRAASIIRRCDALIAPRAATCGESLALQITGDCIDGQEVIERVYSMVRDEQRTERCWAEIADLVAEHRVICFEYSKLLRTESGHPLRWWKSKRQGGEWPRPFRTRPELPQPVWRDRRHPRSPRSEEAEGYATPRGVRGDPQSEYGPDRAGSAPTPARCR